MTPLPSIIDTYPDTCRIEAVSEDCRLITNSRIRYKWAGKRHAWSMPGVNDDAGAAFHGSRRHGDQHRPTVHQFSHDGECIDCG